MKQLTVLLLLFSLSVTAQNKWSLNLGIDPKLAAFGTDNEFTTHDNVLNMHAKIELIGREDSFYFAIGVEYANLDQEYRAWFLDVGKPIFIRMNRCEDILLIPQLEFGNIFRENINDLPFEDIKWNDTYYYGAALSVRYPIDTLLTLGLEGSVDRASDLPDRGFRYGGKLELIFTF